ncbi:rod shape-determining protein MreD [Celerinatantimonas sp. YJH-8]|uniref:rod shape-determining protein MreD n=1 Tax=Celerinatantimonas sp. YJH-8 TaxID=3228714 RepID=UPI0038C2AA38
MGILSFIFALILQILPLPEQVAAFRPDWVVAVLIYWCMALPHRFSIGTAFICGLLLDLLLGSTLGVRALALSLIAYVTVVNYVRMRNLSLWQQAVVVGVLVVICKSAVFWIEYVLKGVEFPTGYFYPALTTMVIWPWIYLLLRKIRCYFKLE